MGGSETAQTDSEYYKNISFYMNILVCGDYNIKFMEKDLENFEIPKEKELKYIKKGRHKNINDWNYFFFEKNTSIGSNTLNCIKGYIIEKNYKSLIVFYSGLNNFTYQNLLEFYDKQPDTYHPNIIIVTKKNEEFELPELKKLNPDLIRNVQEDNVIGLLINIIEVTSYCNELGDEIGYPKKFVNDRLVDRDGELMSKDSFTFNILVCGKPGSGKSLLINRILGKFKCFYGKGTSSLTSRVVKYIHDKLPLIIYDTPGFEKPEDIERVKKLIEDKNKTLNEEKNQIHCIFYCMNTSAERTFIAGEFSFLKSLLDRKMDIYFIATHSGTKEKSKDYIEATKLSLLQNSNIDQRLSNLENNIYPVELKDEGEYKKFGLSELFISIYERYKDRKIGSEITYYNLSSIKSPFLGYMKSKENVKIRLTALAKRVKSNFKILASSMGQTPSVKGTTMLSTSIIKIISKIYDHPITTEECLRYIKNKGYTNELIEDDTVKRKIEKGFATVFYKNGPAAKEVDYLAECLIDQYNKELDNNRKFFDFLNNYRNGINDAIESLKNIKD